MNIIRYINHKFTSPFSWNRHHRKQSATGLEDWHRVVKFYTYSEHPKYLPCSSLFPPLPNFTRYFQIFKAFKVYNERLKFESLFVICCTVNSLQGMYLIAGEGLKYPPLMIITRS